MTANRPPHVMILGAGRAMVRPIAEVVAAGFEVTAVDSIPMPFAFDSATRGLNAEYGDAEQLARAIDDAGHVDGVVATNEQGLRALARIAPQFGLLAQTEQAARIVSSKRLQRECIAARAGRWAVPMAVVENRDGVVAFAVEHGWPVIVKPELSGGGSRGVSLARCDDDADRAFEFAAAAAETPTIIVESALSGEQYSCEVLHTAGACEILAIGRKRKSAPPYRVDMAVIYPSGLSSAEIEVVTQMVNEVVDSVEMRETALHIEFAMTPSGPRTIEINGRVGGGFTPSLVAASTGRNPLVEFCRIACRLPAEGLSETPTPKGAVYKFTSYPPGKVEGFTIPADIENDPHVLDVSMFLPLDRVVRPLCWTSQRVGQIGVVDRDAEAAVARADMLSARLTVRYADGTESAPLPD